MFTISHTKPTTAATILNEQVKAIFTAMQNFG